MLEITIDDKVYKFKFGLGFVRDLDKKMSVEIQNGIRENIGLNYTMAKVFEGDALALVDVLDLANKYAGEPRVNRNLLENYIEDESTDIDQLFEQVIYFFEQSNATKTLAKSLKAELLKRKIEQNS